MSLNKVLEIARRELGNTESPAGSNNTKYGAAYGLQGQPWCVIALWFWFREAGESAAFFGGAKTASCGKLLRWYREQGQTVPVEQVQRGDIVILNFHGTKDTEHCGLVTCVYDSDDGIRFVDTIEGNTSKAGSQDNGGMVCEKTRYPSQIVGVCRPKYKEEKVTKNDFEGRWSEKVIREALDDGVLNGYPDGSFKPTDVVTREELAQFYANLKEKGLVKK